MHRTDVKVPNIKLVELKEYFIRQGAQVLGTRQFFERRGAKRRSRKKCPMLFSVLKLSCAVRVSIPRGCRELPQKKLSISSTPKRR